MNLRKARVVAVHPQFGTCDLVFLDNGQRVTDVEIMGDSSTSGCSWRTPNVPPPSSEALATKVEGALRNLVAYCATAYGRPVVMGFSRPGTGLSVSEQNRWLDAHDISGSYMTFAPDGTYEVFIPGGGYLRIGTGAAHTPVPLSAGALPTTGPAAITLTLATAAGTLSLSPAGAWTLTGAMLAINCPVTITGNTSIVGSLTVSGDATIGGKGYLEHKHGGVTEGDDTSGVPV